jgi:uncharacterized membrane protein (UPF0127 family)
MRAAGNVKIVLVRNRRRQALIALVASLLAVIVLGFWGFCLSDDRTVLIGRKHFLLQVASTPETQEKGLGGRFSLPDDHGMLFVFDEPARRCFWMKDTHVPLDIVWLSPTKRITHIESRVSPKTYPAAFCADPPAQYVIELAAGQASRAGIRPGQAVNF